MIIYAVKVNHITNPLGYTMERTIFTWKVKDAQGTGQKEARILVAADPEMNAILFDTGFRADISNLGYKADIDLSPRTRYYWTVTVRTDAEGEEAASDVQWFETAKMDEMWQAKWITCGNSGEIHPCLEKEVKPEGEVAKARLYISGLGL